MSHHHEQLRSMMTTTTTTTTSGSTTTTNTSSHLRSMVSVLFGLALCLAPISQLLALPATPVVGQKLAEQQRHELDPTLGQLILVNRLSKRDTGGDLGDSGDASMLMKQQIFKNKQHALMKKQKLNEMEEEKRLKLELRTKWHKIVDDLIEDEFSQGQKAQVAIKSSALSEPIARHRDSQQQQQKRAPTQSETSDNDRFLLILKKRPSTLEGQVSNQLEATNDNLQQQQQQQQQQAAGGANNPNSNEHARRILDDKFGIMKESIFTTNNHLGYKGVPKFGSDEVF